MARQFRTPTFHGIDFTSAPRRAKPIVVANGQLRDDHFELLSIEDLPTFEQFEHWLRRPGPWVGGFDFPFGLPREALIDLGWPQEWAPMTRHCRSLGRVTMRQALEAHRAGRPAGRKYCYRKGDAAAGSHSPLKLVNPPVALMFLEGACRLADAEVTIPGMRLGDPQRICLEAYPGYAVRRLLPSRRRWSYKNDAPGKQTAARTDVRCRIVRVLADEGLDGVRLQGDAALVRALIEDGTGDRLDAVLCALQAVRGWQHRDRNFGLPLQMDPVEGWIVTVPVI